MCDRKQEALSGRSGTAADDNEDIDPKLKDAMLKSRKLDRILQRKFQQEKNIKRERLELNHRSVVSCLETVFFRNFNQKLLCGKLSEIEATVFWRLILPLYHCIINEK